MANLNVNLNSQTSRELVLAIDDIVLNRHASRKFVPEINGHYESKSENFRDILQHSQTDAVREGALVKGYVKSISKTHVLVCVGAKSEGRINRREFVRQEGDIEELSVDIGSEVSVYVEKIEGRDGNIVLSKEKAERWHRWDVLEDAFKNNQDVQGTVVSLIRSGCIVNLDKLVAFLPNSHIDLKPVKDMRSLMGKSFAFRILKMDKKQGNIVISRRALLNSVYAKAKEEYLHSLEEGSVITGIIKSITNYGVFVGIHDSAEVGVIDGLVHITDMSWGRVSHPTTFFSCGQEVTVKVISVNPESGRVSLGMKQLTQNPWVDMGIKYPIGSTVEGKVTSVEEYGIFVELSPGIEGLVHSSEISWVRSYKPFSRGQKVPVSILSVDPEKSRVALSIRQAAQNPWAAFLKKNPLGTIVKCKVKSVADTGISVSFYDQEDILIEGFIKASDIKNSDSVKHAREYRIGEEIKAKVLYVNISKGAIGLGVKQITYDPFKLFLETVSEGDLIKAVMVKIDGAGIYVRVTPEVEIFVDRKELPELISLSIGHEQTFRIAEKSDYYLRLQLEGRL